MNHVKELILQLVIQKYDYVSDNVLEYFIPLLDKSKSVTICPFISYVMIIGNFGLEFDIIEKHNDYIIIVFKNTDISIKFKILSLKMNYNFEVSLVDGFE